MNNQAQLDVVLIKSKVKRCIHRSAEEFAEGEMNGKHYICIPIVPEDWQV